MASLIYRGSALRFSVVVKNAAGTLIDPTTLTLVVSDRGGAIKTLVYGTDADLIKDSTGNFHADYIVAGYYGKWKCKFTSTGTGAGVGQVTFTVEE
mgnify:CR=1 FL=1